MWISNQSCRCESEKRSAEPRNCKNLSAASANVAEADTLVLRYFFMIVSHGTPMKLELPYTMTPIGCTPSRWNSLSAVLKILGRPVACRAVEALSAASATADRFKTAISAVTTSNVNQQ